MRAAVSINHQPDAGNMALWARAVLLGAGDAGVVRDLIKDMPSAVQKAANSPMLTSDSDMEGLSNTRTILTQFVPLLRNASVFFRLLDGLMLRLPLRTRVSYLSGSVTMANVAEGGVIPVTRMSSDRTFIEPEKAVGILAFSREMIDFLTDAGQGFLSLELRRAVAAAVDATFFPIVQSGAPSQLSNGDTASDALQDLKFLLTSCGLTSESRPMFVGSPDVGIAAATLDSNGVLLFPKMSPIGGELLNLPCMISDALPAGTLALLDGAGIGGDAQGVKLSYAGHATLQLNDAPDSPPTASTTFVNLWQSNLIGVKPEVTFGVAKLRDNAFARVTGINWGGGSH